MIDPRQIAPADARQLDWNANERNRLEGRIRSDFRAALADHQARMTRWARYYRRWRNLSDTPAIGEETKSNFRVPLTKWHIYTKIAKEHASLFGDDAEVVANPVGPSDQRNTRKAGRFMSWLTFNHIKVPNKAQVFNFRKVTFGRAIAYSPYAILTYEVPLVDGSRARDVYYEGPLFDPLWPDDFIVPAEDVQSLHDFSWVIRKYRATPDELAIGEEEGRYQNVSAHWEDIVHFVSHRRQRDFESEPIKREKDLAEGVLYEGNLSAASTLIVHEWYGKWRKLRGRRDASIDNLGGREQYESDLVVRYIPDLNLIVSIQDLAEMYPRQVRRRPLVEASLTKDGSYWCAGFGEMLEEVEEEMTSNHNTASQAGQFSCGPIIFYRPASGFDPDTFQYEPNTCVASDDPAGVRVVEMRANLEYPVLKEQTMNGYAERLSGQTDMSMGRAIDRPNAPRTARQTIALLEEGDVRASLDMSALREDWGEILGHFWELMQDYAPEEMFFRVTEEDANGLFDVKDGGSYMTAEERNGRYDFSLKFATNKHSKEQRKQDDLALYQLDLQNPLVVQNPRALWHVLDKVHKAFGDDRFSDLVPMPPDTGLPLDPKEEYTRMLQGEQVRVNPMDNDQLHLLDHSQRIEKMRASEEHDEDALRAMVLHAQEHMQQIRQKQLMAELTSRLVDSMAANSATGRGLMHSGVPMSLQNLHGTLTDLIGNNGAPAAGLPGAGNGGGNPG
ncbi:MAG TPA: hypothetical protein VE734_10410 [Terriglobales bacterium]|jgi:hypothetical protein|nr:hypothetical protein [Terriglobales bacterium]